MYWIRTKLGDREIVTPYMMTAEQYRELTNRREMFDYFQEKNSEIFEKKEKQAFNIFDMNFALGRFGEGVRPGRSASHYIRLHTDFDGCQEQQD